MAVIQEYYSSRFDPGAPALVSFLGGFMESRRDLNQMAFKERLAGIDPGAAALVEAAAIKRRTELEKMAQDAILARESNNATLQKAASDNATKLAVAGISAGGALAGKRTEVAEKAAAREQSRLYKVESAVETAKSKQTSVATSTRNALATPASSPRAVVDMIDNAVDDALTGPAGIARGLPTDPQAREAARLSLYAAAAAEVATNPGVLAELKNRLGGRDPSAALAAITAPRTPKQVAGEIPTYGIDVAGMVASAYGETREQAQARLRAEAGAVPVGPGVVAGPTTAPAAPAGTEVVGSMPAATGVVAPPLFEAEIAQAKALEEQARQQRLGGRGDVPYGKTEVGRANLLYGMPYYRGRAEYDMEQLAPRAPVEAEQVAVEGTSEGAVEDAAVAGMEVPVQVTRRYKPEGLESGTRYYGGPALQPRMPSIPTAGVDKPAPRLEVPLSPQAAAFVQSAAGEMDEDLANILDRRRARILADEAAISSMNTGARK